LMRCLRPTLGDFLKRYYHTALAQIILWLF
jgi:hypothetical protein